MRAWGGREGWGGGATRGGMDAHGRVQPERLVDDAVEVRHLALVQRVKGGVRVSEHLRDLAEQLLLGRRVLREQVKGPREAARCCVAA